MNYSMEKPKYKYRVYGLNVWSEFRIDGLVETTETVNTGWVSIRFDKVCERIKEKINQGINMEVSKDETWFNINGTAIYQIKNGNEIILDKYEDPDYTEINLYLMCTCMGFIMLQREKLALHGATVVVNDKAVIITGRSGAGKSTLTTGFRLKGYKFLSDDVSAISKDNEKIKVNYGFPYQKLCLDSVNLFKYNYNKFKSFDNITNRKYLIPDYENFAYDDYPLKFIVELTTEDVDRVQIEEITGINKLKCILKSIYRIEYVSYLSPTYIKMCSNLAANVRYYKMSRPDNKFTVDEQISNIRQMII